MNAIFLDIRGETEALREEVERVSRKGARYASDTDPEVKDSHLASIANGLHGIYTGIEHVLKMLIHYFDGELPQGKQWHRLLLKRACRENPSILSEPTCAILDELRGFRYIFRSHYHTNLVPDRGQNTRTVSARPEPHCA